MLARDCNIAFIEIGAFEQHGFARLRCQCVRTAIENIQPGWMPHAFAEMPVSLEGEPGLRGRESRNLDSRVRDELVENCDSRGAFLAVDDDACFKKRRALIRGPDDPDIRSI